MTAAASDLYRGLIELDQSEQDDHTDDTDETIDRYDQDEFDLADGVMTELTEDHTGPTLITDPFCDRSAGLSMRKPWSNIGQFTLRDAVLTQHPLIAEQLDGVHHFWLLMRAMNR